MITEILISIIAVLASSLLGVSDTFIKLFFKTKRILENDKKTQETLSRKLERLTNNLQETSSLMEEIETEFQQQKELAEKWNKEAETSKIIASMNEKEIEAVTKLFGGVIKEDEKRTSRKSWWWNLFFCIIGIIGGFLVSKYFL